MDLASASWRQLGAKPHHRHQTRSAEAAAAVGAAGSFTHGNNRASTASAHAIIHRGTTQPASDTAQGRSLQLVSATHTHTRNRHTELNSFVRLASDVAFADALSATTHALQ